MTMSLVPLRARVSDGLLEDYKASLIEASGWSLARIADAAARATVQMLTSEPESPAPKTRVPAAPRRG